MSFTKIDHSPSPTHLMDGRRSLTPIGRRSRSRSPIGNSGSGDVGGPSRRSAKVGTRRLFLSNIPYEFDWRKLKDLVKDEVGEECYVDIALDRRGKNLGFGLLEFRTVDAAEKGVDRLDQTEVHGRRMIVREMTRRDEERWSEAQREKGASANNGSGMSGYHHGSSGSTSSGSKVQPSSNADNIPIPILQIMRRHNIEPPLSRSVFVANIAFECEERKVKEIFSAAGRVTCVDLKREADGASRGFGIIEYESEFEALQAICMFNNALVHDRALRVRFDVKSENASKFPSGVKNVGPGFGSNGEPLPHIGLLQSLPELLQLLSPSIFTPILSSLGIQAGGGSYGGGGSLNSLGGASTGYRDIAAIAAAIASQTTVPSAGGYSNIGMSSASPAHHHVSHHHNDFGGGSSAGGGGYLGSAGPAWGGNGSGMAPSGGGGGSSRGEPTAVVVSNLPPGVNWRQVKERFSDVGDVKMADIVSRSSSTSTALIYFTSPNDAKRATRLLNEARFEGRQMDVRLDYV